MAAAREKGVKVLSLCWWAFSRRIVTSRGAPHSSPVTSANTFSAKMVVCAAFGYSMRAGKDVVRLRPRRLAEVGLCAWACACDAASDVVGQGDSGDEKKVENERLCRRTCLSGRSAGLTVGGVRGEADVDLGGARGVGGRPASRIEGRRRRVRRERARCVRERVGCCCCGRARQEREGDQLSWARSSLERGEETHAW